MFSRIFVVAFLIAAVGQIVVTQPTEVNEEQYDFKALHDHATNSLNRLKQKLDTMAADAQKKLDKLVEDVKQKGQDVIEKNKQRIHDESLRLQAEIETIEREAQALDIVVDFEQQKEDIRMAEERGIAELIECVAIKVEEFVQIVKNIVNKILTTIEFYAGVKEQIEKCKAGSNKVVCIIRVIGEIIDKTLTLPVYILNQVAKASLLVSNFVNDILACAARKHLAFEQEGNLIVAQVREILLKRIQ